LKTLFLMTLATATAGAVRICDLSPDAGAALPDDDTDLLDGPVIYISAENGQWEEKRRYSAIRRGLGLTAPLLHPFHFVDGSALSLRLARPTPYDYVLGDFADAEMIPEVDELFEKIEQVKPRMIVFDTITHLADLSNENDNSVVRRFLKERLLPAAREHGAAVYVVLHPPKHSSAPGAPPRSEVRGAGAWRHAADTTLVLQRAPALGPDAATITLSKVRRGPKHSRRIGFRVTDGPKPTRSSRQ